MTENSLSGIAFIVYGTQLVYAFPLLAYELCGLPGNDLFVYDCAKLAGCDLGLSFGVDDASSSLPFPPPGLLEPNIQLNCLAWLALEKETEFLSPSAESCDWFHFVDPLQGLRHRSSSESAVRLPGFAHARVCRDLPRDLTAVVVDWA